MIADLEKAQTSYFDFHQTHENDPKVVYQTIENKKFKSGKTIAPLNILLKIQLDLCAL